MLPIFKSHYSIGKSILTLDYNKTSIDESADSIFALVNENKIKNLILVEDSLTGFLQAMKGCKKFGVNLIFGLRMSVCNDVSEENPATSTHKVIIFPKNKNGCIILNKLYTLAKTKNNGFLDFKIINEVWDKDSLKMSIPFYDSFVFNNALKFSNCIPDFSNISPDFFIEENGLPFDSIVKGNVLSFCDDGGFNIFNSKSIYYNKREDFDAYTTYKCICNRKYFLSSLDKPNFDHLGSREFSLQSWREGELV
jgi:DNA polymerase III alpha subunit